MKGDLPTTRVQLTLDFQTEEKAVIDGVGASECQMEYQFLDETSSTDLKLLNQVLGSNDKLYRSVREILSDNDLELTIYLKNNDSYIKYFTTAMVNRVTKNLMINRTYCLASQNPETPKIFEIWGGFDPGKQAVIVTNLIKLSLYERIVIETGWEATCKKCGSFNKGAHWNRVNDRKCSKCNKNISNHNIRKAPPSEFFKYLENK